MAKDEKGHGSEGRGHGRAFYNAFGEEVKPPKIGARITRPNGVTGRVTKVTPSAHGPVVWFMHRGAEETYTHTNSPTKRRPRNT